jgi:hypothetical protein
MWASMLDNPMGPHGLLRWYIYRFKKPVRLWEIAAFYWIRNVCRGKRVLDRTCGKCDTHFMPPYFSVFLQVFNSVWDNYTVMEESCQDYYVYVVVFRSSPYEESSEPPRLTVIFFLIPFYLQSVLVHSANCVKTYTVACRRVLSSAPL